MDEFMPGEVLRVTTARPPGALGFHAMAVKPKPRKKPPVPKKPAPKKKPFRGPGKWKD